MRNDDFVEASGYLRVLEKRILSTADIGRIADSPSVSEALRLLSQNSEYDFNSIAKTEDYETVLKAELKRIYELMYKISPHQEVVDIPAAKYDFHNMKTAIKARYIKGDVNHLYSDVARIKGADIEKYLSAAKDGNVLERLPEYAAVDDAISAYEEYKNPEDIDISLDKSMYRHILELCGKVGSELITEYIRCSIDFYNVKAFMRVKNMRKGLRFLNNSFIDGGTIDTAYFLQNYDKSYELMASVFYYKYFGDIMQQAMAGYEKNKNFSMLEKLFDNRLMDIVKKSKYVAFGPELIYSYILSKENEIRQIRILIAGKYNNVSVESIHERLRDNYA